MIKATKTIFKLGLNLDLNHNGTMLLAAQSPFELVSFLVKDEELGGN